MTATDAPAGISLRPFYCPVPEAVHPHVAEVERGALAWVDRIGLAADDEARKRLLRTRSADFFSRFAPCADEDGLQIAVRWVYWGFLFDDRRCDAGRFSDDPLAFPPMAASVQRAVDAPWCEAVDDRYARAVQDIVRSMYELRTPTQARRFADAHRGWLFAVAWQVANRARGHMPDLDDYTAMRLHTCGGGPTIALLEIANGPEVPGAEMDSPAVRALTEMAILIAAWDNDLHSYDKEFREDNTDQNLANVLAHHRRLHPDEAVAEAVRLRDRVMTRFLRLREAVAARPVSGALRTYLDGLGHAIRGNIDWALSSPRYRGLVNPGWADEPSDDNPDPLPLPTIAWWWDDL
ncbi:terpene synthase family protein [Saccharothrix xinjiangensis]|uniref:Terpene synthase n=1 Tax=Saccharothrix xinjiangensis TaxID=204798 RepID=A0ABV9Y7P2_9PSEU